MSYINKKETQALHDAWDYVNNLLEGCEVNDNNKDVIELIHDTLNGLQSLIKKSKH